MRDLTSQEADYLRERGRCCFCHAKLRPGPRGGLSQNFYCLRESCEAGFNLTPTPLPCQLIQDPMHRSH